MAYLYYTPESGSFTTKHLYPNPPWLYSRRNDSDSQLSRQVPDGRASLIHDVIDNL